MRDLKEVVSKAVASTGITRVNEIQFNDGLIRELKDKNHPHGAKSFQALLQLKWDFVEEIEGILLNWVDSDSTYEEKNLFTTSSEWRDYVRQYNGNDLYDFFDDIDSEKQYKKDYFHIVAVIVYEHIVTKDYEIPDYWKASFENE